VTALKIALAQRNPTVGDLEGNAKIVADDIERARDANADVVAFTELVVTGYPPEDLVLKPSFVRANENVLAKLAQQTEQITAVIGFVHEQDSSLYNAAAICTNGEIAGIYHKHHLPQVPADGAGVFDEDRYFTRGTGEPVFDIAGTKIGITICEDIWHEDGPAKTLAAKGAEVIVNINGSPYRTGIVDIRERMLAARAKQYGITLAYVNTVGGQDELVFDGNSLIFDPQGNITMRGPQFEEALLFGDEHAARLPFEEEVYKALCVGTRDYVRKNGFREVFVALSGGIDSALTAAIAVDALGPDAVTGVIMSSKHSSKHSRDDAFVLAKNLGIRTLDIPIEAAHGSFETALREHIEGLPGTDLAEQNIQSRIRGIIMLALSNARPDSIVLTTGNKSEMATGYATLYGDMAGGFAVLKDVPKLLVYRLARWRGNIPKNTIDKPPSAELKPDQRDDDVLPPYEILDPILEAYVEQDRSLKDIVAMGFDEETVRTVIRMVDMNEYKRRQAPPGPKITSKAFGRDRRLPITNRYRES
jgi:NAD+ synthase (glutamine-hydrolysing)